MAPTPFVAIVTGANRGIGWEIARSLTQYPPSRPAIIYSCARNPPAESTIPVPSDSNIALYWTRLDISHPSDITSFADKIKAAHPDGVDVLINNAGVNVDYDEGKNVAQKARETIATNFDGTLGMCEAFGALMRRSGLDGVPGGKSRIVNVSSTASHASGDRYGKEVLKGLAESKTVADVKKLRDAYLEAAETGKPGQYGWAGQSYSVSKALMNSLTQVLAQDEKLGQGILVNCCCPGWVDTGMGNFLGKPPKTLEEGSRIPLRLGLGDVGGVSGKFWENGEGVFGKGYGDVQEWVH